MDVLKESSSFTQDSFNNIVCLISLSQFFHSFVNLKKILAHLGFPNLLWRIEMSKSVDSHRSICDSFAQVTFNGVSPTDRLLTKERQGKGLEPAAIQ